MNSNVRHGESVRWRRRRKKRIADRGMRAAECGREQYSSEEFVELVVRTDPCPRNRVATAFANCAISVADSD